jgi:hypothetical protein
MGNLITTALIQLLIQRRITTLSVQYLFEQDQRIKDVETACDTKKDQIVAQHWHIVPTWVLLVFLFLGLAGSVVGYFGCYTVISGAPFVWIVLETILSLIRSAICTWNPTSDPPPLEIILELNEYKPFPTCNKDNEEILQHKVLPLTRAEDFLKIITSFAGLIEPFNNPNLFLYYTLTLKLPSKMSVELGEWTIYHGFRSQGAYDTSLHPRQRNRHFLLNKIGCARL